MPLSKKSGTVRERFSELNPANLRKFIAGDKNAPGSRLLYSLLKLAAMCYAAVVAVRNWLYDKSVIRAKHAEVPVVCVGNITTGGTGKTPLVAWLCNMLAKKGFRCAVLTRGYKAGKGAFADEPAMLARAAAKAKVIVNPDRVAGAAKATKKFDANVIIMDDGFGHRRLARDLDIIAIDATEPFGYGRLLPAGLLREPVKSIRRADAVVITRFNQSVPEHIAEIENRIKQIKPEILLARAIHKPIAIRMMKNVELSFEQLREKKVFAFCGIGNPEAFYSTLAELKLNVTGSKTYCDHHDYSQDDVARICEEARYLEADIIISSQKDWVKTALLSLEKFDIPFAYLIVELEFIAGQDTITDMIEKVLSNKPAH